MAAPTSRGTPYISQFVQLPSPTPASGTDPEPPKETGAPSSGTSSSKQIGTTAWLAKQRKPHAAQEASSKGEEELEIVNTYGAYFWCATMLAQHFEAGPRLGVPEFFVNDHFISLRGDTPAHRQARETLASDGYKNPMVALVKREGLVSIPNCALPNMRYPLDALKFYLDRSGPIMFYWNKTNPDTGKTYRHCSLIVEIRNEQIIYYDPDDQESIDGDPEKKMSIKEFNQRRLRFPYAMLQRQGALERYPNRDKADLFPSQEPDYSNPECRKGNIRYLEVPYEGQFAYWEGDDELTEENLKGRDDPTGCWYSVAKMINGYFGTETVGIPELYNPDPDTIFGMGDIPRRREGHSNLAGHFETLMKNERLEAVPESEVGGRPFSIDELDKLIKKGGPIFFILEIMNESTHRAFIHACLITGVDKDRGRVIYHDPRQPGKTENRTNDISMTIEQFNIVRDHYNAMPMLQRSKKAEGSGKEGKRAQAWKKLKGFGNQVFGKES